MTSGCRASEKFGSSAREREPRAAFAKMGGVHTRRPAAVEGADGGPVRSSGGGSHELPGNRAF